MSVRYRLRGSTAKEIVESVEEGVRSGGLAAGALLPSVRALADELGVSPGTVAAAYRTLADRAVVVAQGRAGTRVRPRPPIAARAPGPAPVAGPGRDLARGNPDPKLLPDLADALRVVARRQSPVPYGAPAVLPELDAAARRWFAHDKLPVPALAVVSGALDGVERALGAWLRPGDRVAVEDPGYPPLYDVVAAMGMEAVPVPVDRHGMDPDALAAVLNGVSAVVVTPSAQNPTGAHLTAERARALRKVLAAAPDVLLVEDDHAAMVSLPPLVAAANVADAKRQGPWALVRSVAKAIGPDLRLAVVAGDPVTIARIEGRHRLGPGWVSTILQATVAHLLEDSAARGRRAQAGSVYAKRRQALVEELAARGIEAWGSSGLNVWVPLPTASGADEQAVVAGMAARGWLVAPGARYRIRSGAAVRITVASLLPVEAKRVAADLAAVLADRPARSYTQPA